MPWLVNLCNGSRAGWLARTLHAWAADTRGSAAAVSAVLFPVVIGGMGLGAETGYWYLQQRELQHAADLAAHAAGTRKRAGDSSARLRQAAMQIATKAGFDDNAGDLTVNVPPTSQTYRNNNDALEVVLTRNTPRLFSAIFTQTPVSMEARAVTLIRGGQQACVLALSPDAAGAVTLSGSSLVNLNGCDLASNSLATDSVLMNGGSASLAAGCVYAVGEIVATTRLTLTECDSVKEFASITADPYAGVAEPPTIACGGPAALNSPAAPVHPEIVLPSGVKAMRFCEGLDISGTVEFEPGLYIIESQPFTANGGAARILGDGVTFFLTNGATARLNGNAFMDVSAPTEGPYSGLVFFGGRAGTGLAHQVNGTAGSVVQGAVYFPAGHISFSGNSKTSGGGGCTQVIGNTIELTGNSSLNSSCELTGTRSLLANRFVRLVE